MKTRRIAVFTRAGFSYHIRIGWGFLGEVRRRGLAKWDIAMYEVAGATLSDRECMRSQMIELLEKPFDVVVVVGSLRAQIALQFMEEHNIQIPMVFVGIGNPVRLGLLPELKAHKNITGVVSEQFAWDRVARLLHTIKPAMKSVLIPYYRYAGGEYTEARLMEVQQFFAAVGVVCDLHPVDDLRSEQAIREIFEKLPSFDVIWSLEGDFFDVYSYECIEACNASGVTFFSNNVVHVRRGAPLVFAADFEHLGRTLFRQVRAVLLRPRGWPIPQLLDEPNTRCLFVHPAAAGSKRGEIDLEAVSALQDCEVVFVGDDDVDGEASYGECGPF